MTETIKLAYNFPVSFRKGLITQILTYIDRGENVTLIGMPGMGVSTLGMQMSTSPLIQDRRLVFLNLNLLSLSSEKELVGKLRQIVGSTDGNLTIFIDPFERAAETKLSNFMSMLDGWRREKFGNLTYIFTVEGGIVSKERKEIFRPMTKLMMENMVRMPLLDTEESRWFCQSIASQYHLDIKKTEEDILRLSGGYMQTIKRIIQALSRGIDIKEIEKNSKADIHLNYHIERAWEAAEKDQYWKGMLNQIPLFSAMGNEKPLTLKE